jgi:hypothetical protein
MYDWYNVSNLPAGKVMTLQFVAENSLFCTCVAPSNDFCDATELHISMKIVPSWRSVRQGRKDPNRLGVDDAEQNGEHGVNEDGRLMVMILMVGVRQR